MVKSAEMQTYESVHEGLEMFLVVPLHTLTMVQPSITYCNSDSVWTLRLS